MRNVTKNSKAHLLTSIHQNLEKSVKVINNYSQLWIFFENFHSNEVDRRSLLFSVVFSILPEKYFVK